MKCKFLRGRETHSLIPAGKQKKKIQKYVIGIIGCVGVLGISSAIIIPMLWKPSSTPSIPEEYVSGMTMGIAKMSSWEELDLPGKYPDLLIGENLFTTTHDTIPKEKVGEFLFHTTLTGYDTADPTYYKDKENARQETIDADVYAVQGIGRDYLVAVQYKGADGFYTYFPHSYTPQTLGEFAVNLNLKENLQIKSIAYVSGNQEQQYTITDAKPLWDIIFANSSAAYYDPNDTDIFNVFHACDKLTIEVSMELAGEPDASISISENGYVFTNLYQSGKLFYIGEENAAAVMRYLLDSSQGKV